MTKKVKQSDVKAVAKAAIDKASKPALTPVSYLPHPLAEAVPGEMEQGEFDALCVSVKAHGLRNPVMLFEGKMLDGRARYKACVKTGVQPDFLTMQGTEAGALAYVMDNNLHRRQLNSIQKGLVGARMHMRKENPLTQKDAAAMVGVSVATVCIAVRLLNSNNTPVIRRAENGGANRSEIDEILFDREASRAQAAANATPPDDGADDDLFGTLPSNVTRLTTTSKLPPLSSGSGTVAGKRSESGHKAVETSPSKLVATFKAMSPGDRKAFVDMAWQWLQPIVEAHRLITVPREAVSARKPKAKKAA